ncbi:MAG: CoA ester lyase [Chloroflexi bacterium]|nr:CoA ester lyase [Chloroflexota bacterium]
MLLRSLLFVPANRERFVAKVATLRPDAVILDLEDSIPADQKEAARSQARAALAHLAEAPFSRLIRVNSLASGLARADIRAVACPHLDGIVLPKAESAEQLREANMLLAQAEARAGLSLGHVRLIPILETVRGVLRAEALAAAGPRIVAVVFGAEDYTLDVGGIRTREGLEVLYARAHVVAAARAARVAVIDTPWTDLADQDGLWQEARLARQLGFSGKLCIHPSQIEPIHRAFTPTAEEVEAARRVVETADEAARQGRGSVALDGRMLDAPIVGQARRLLAQAEAIGRRDEAR